jgi:iron(III) transport system permease protein
MSAMALAGALAVGVTAAYMLVKGPLRRWRGSADAALTLPYAIPGTVLAVALILAFSTPGVFGGGAVLVGTFAILPLAYLVRTYPLLLRSTAAALDAVDDSLLEAAESLGAGEWRRFRTVVLPLVAGGIAAGATLVLIATLGEFVASILLYTYASRPVSVEILSQLRAFNFGGAAAYAVILLGVMVALVSAGARAERTAAGGLGPFSG